jgi:hypothetical protein
MAPGRESLRGAHEGVILPIRGSRNKRVREPGARPARTERSACLENAPELALILIKAIKHHPACAADQHVDGQLAFIKA